MTSRHSSSSVGGWYEEGVTDSLPGALSVLNCLGFLPGSNCPHYNDEAQRRPSYQKFVASGQIKPGIAQDQCVALHYRGTELYKVIAGKENQKAYSVSLDGDSVIETIIEAKKI